MKKLTLLSLALCGIAAAQTTQTFTGTHPPSDGCPLANVSGEDNCI